MKSVRISDETFEAAAQEGALMSRSTAGQLEHWIKLGRKLEQCSSQDEIRALLAKPDQQRNHKKG